MHVESKSWASSALLHGVLATLLSKLGSQSDYPEYTPQDTTPRPICAE